MFIITIISKTKEIIMARKTAILISIVLVLSVGLSAAGLEMLKEIKGLDHPSSIYYDSAANSYFITNMGKMGTVKDNDGFISWLSGDLKNLDVKWIKGTKKNPLHEPRGIAVIKGMLYVTDLDEVKGYDLKTGARKTLISFKDKEKISLADIGTDGRNLFVTCAMTGRIYIYSPENGKYAVWFESDKIKSLRGILVLPGFGRVIVGDPVEGKIYTVNLQSKKVIMINDKIVGVDGLDISLNGDLIYSSFTHGIIQSFSQKRMVTTILKIPTAIADISIDHIHDFLLVPLTLSNRARIYRLNTEKPDNKDTKKTGE